MLDLSLSDALTDGVPQASPESRVERDFVAQLEAEPFEDEVGETVGKTDYIPLLDNDDNRAARSLLSSVSFCVSLSLLPLSPSLPPCSSLSLHVFVCLSLTPLS
uniref:Uncharacterized protein n=1 Tax=Periophthalmus magnuspinnatus TaxID=409849 RepID=A0A3B4BG41_9GOBI